MRKHAASILALGLVLATGVPGGAVEARPATPGVVATGDPVIAWNVIATDAMVTAGISPNGDPMHESRVYAMVHTAVHDALNAIERHSQPYALDIGTKPGASPVAAVATAAHDSLVSALAELPSFATGVPAAVDAVDHAYDVALQTVQDPTAKRLGVAIGRAAAAVIIAQRADDGADATFFDTTPIVNPKPGQFRWVQFSDFEVIPNWSKVTPWVMTSTDQFRPRPPYDLTSKKYAADFNEMKALGGLNSTGRTPDQTQIAFFWFENSPIKWNRIARTVSQAAGLDMWQNARLFALLNVVEADGYVGNWESKQFYDRWRPETAVRYADTDGNPLTVKEDGWLPLWGSSGATPEYDSGHTIEGAGAAAVLADVLGTDRVTFEACSFSFVPSTVTTFDTKNNCDGSAPITRTYHSFSEAAWENGQSRIYVGWHFRNAVDSGFRHGTLLGMWALHRYFRPTH
jgi:PAP2 superfamily